MHVKEWLQKLLYFLKHSKVHILIVTKYFTNLYNNKEVNQRLNRNMKIVYTFVKIHNKMPILQPCVLSECEYSTRKNPPHVPIRVLHILDIRSMTLNNLKLKDFNSKVLSLSVQTENPES
jgi:hypothetical protein